MGDFQLTAAQREASDRHDVEEVLYLLSGTLPGRGAVPDAVFYWATRGVTVPLGAAGADVVFESYLSYPTRVLRAFGFEPGKQASNPAVPIPVRNLPFTHSESLVAAFSDDDYSFEAATATLRVAYIRPGQTVDDLVEEDFRPLVLNGFFGPPENVLLDGFTLPLHTKNAKRNQSLLLPELPGDESFAGQPMDQADVGRMAPMIIGRPDGWFKPPTYQINHRGFLASGHSAGATEIVFELITTTGAVEDLWTPDLWSNNQKLHVHYRTPLYEITTGSYDPERREVTLILASGLSSSVPRGGYCEHRRISGAPGTAIPNAWLVAAHRYGSVPTVIQLGWRFPDGSIRPAPRDPWISQIESRDPTSRGGKKIGHGLFSDSAINFSVVEIQQGDDDDPIPGVYFDPGAISSVTQQPEFTSISNLTRANYGTGGTGTDNDKIRDGNTQTGIIIPDASVRTITFNSAPSPYDDGDTIESTLHVVAWGTGSFTALGGTPSFGSITAGGSVGELFFVQSSPRSFNETIRIVGGSGGLNITEIWWTHTLQADVAATRTADVVVGETSGAVGELMEFADLVMRFSPDLNQGMDWFVDHTGSNYFIDTTDDRWSNVADVLVSGELIVPNVTPVGAMASLHALLGVEGDVSNIDGASYDAAHLRYSTENIRVNAYLTKRPTSWFELERQLGEEFRSFFYYGPSGHQCHFMETPATLEASGVTVRQSFRLPGAPAANVLSIAGAVMQRTPVSELTNVAEAEWGFDYIEDAYLRVNESSNADSVARLGERRHAVGLRSFRFHSPNPGAASGGVWNAEAQVSEILQVYADRQAFAATRFTFETAWIAHGVDRGSLIRVGYPVSTTPPSYRNVVCEVESIASTPQNAGRYVITARSLYKPTKGIDLALTWAEVFTASGDQWDTRILQVFDTWGDYWSLPSS